MFCKILIMVGVYVLIDYNLNLSDDHQVGVLLIGAVAIAMDILIDWVRS